MMRFKVSNKYLWVDAGSGGGGSTFWVPALSLDLTQLLTAPALKYTYTQ